MSGRSEPRRLLGGVGGLVLSREECRKIIGRIISFARGPGETYVQIRSEWLGDLRWARNRAVLTADRHNVSVSIHRGNDAYRGATITVNQIDDTSLQAGVRAAERLGQFTRASLPDMDVPPQHFDYPDPAIWSDTTVHLTAADRAAAVRTMIDPAEAAGMLSAGYLAVDAVGIARGDSQGTDLYAARTGAQCSTTVRDQTGTGSGWAGASSYDWSKVDPAALGERALRKCLKSRNPVALEPGRYTVILEPQAVGDLVQYVVDAMGRRGAEGGGGPFVLRPRFSKLGLRVMDERITISHDPMDLDLGVIPFAPATDAGEPIRPITWVERGVLTGLSYLRDYALEKLNENLGYPTGGETVHAAFRMSGGETSIDEMIRTTKRGLLITRFSNIRQLLPQSILLTGLTRDGLWLIEDGEISKAVKNFRFTESPLFMLNSIDQLGQPVPVFRPGTPMIVPPLKARDFSFTSLIDAV